MEGGPGEARQGQVHGRRDKGGGERGGERLVHSVPFEALGNHSKSFMDFYGVKYPMSTGSMAKGIASADLVVAGGQKGMLCSLGW